MFSVTTTPKEVVERRRVKEASANRWALRKLNEEEFSAAINAALIAREKGDGSLTTVREWLHGALVKASDAAMPKRRLAQTEAAEYEKAWGVYKEARDALRIAIKEAKSKAWEELLSTLDEDPWGRPYRLVLNKLKGGASPITETLDPSFVSEVVDTLFPMRDLEEDPILQRKQEWDEAMMGLTAGELQRAVRKIKKGKAPGPDGFHGRA
ncbi:uncharacterized protein LOC114939874 [Nylanderia fulva]|uniref:uncharacterized protein LOC114939874 n=1 Tax=Nylanderia fulva TaxID=613905 RepID=UPI0010FB64D0|nr:uncharacterized protein LOC114939874 [Nylanderia fulva]